MTEHTPIRRRPFLVTVGAGAATAVAGCLGGDEAAEQEEETTPDEEADEEQCLVRATRWRRYRGDHDTDGSTPARPVGSWRIF